jgi:hypothetical protein
MIPLTCPEKAAFSTITRSDNFENGLQYAGRNGTGDLDHVPLRMEIEYRGPGYRAGQTNDKQDNNPMENQI